MKPLLPAPIPIFLLRPIAQIFIFSLITVAFQYHLRRKSIHCRQSNMEVTQPETVHQPAEPAELHHDVQRRQEEQAWASIVLSLGKCLCRILVTMLLEYPALARERS